MFIVTFQNPNFTGLRQDSDEDDDEDDDGDGNGDDDGEHLGRPSISCSPWVNIETR